MCGSTPREAAVAQLPHADEVSVGFQVIDVHEIHTGIQELTPHVLQRAVFWGRSVPKPKAVASSMRGLNDLRELEMVSVGEASQTAPFEMVLPVGADQ